jgi:hypothetical protein
VGVIALSWERLFFRKEIAALQIQLAEQDPGDKFQTVRQKLEFARKTLIPKQRWKPGITIEEVSHTEGMVHTLDWLERNHHNAALTMRHVKE